MELDKKAIEARLTPENESRRQRLLNGLTSMDYFQKVMTGAEAFRALQLVLLRWHYLNKDLPLIWFHYEIPCDGALVEDWACALEEMLEERLVWGSGGLPITMGMKEAAFQTCKCCENCKYKD
jgi:hypothetical protein